MNRTPIPHADESTVEDRAASIRAALDAQRARNGVPEPPPQSPAVLVSPIEKAGKERDTLGVYAALMGDQKLLSKWLRQLSDPELQDRRAGTVAIVATTLRRMLKTAEGLK